MIHWRLKGCGRCGGDVLVNGKDIQCLQCGHEPVEASAYALADQERRWEPPIPAKDGRGRWGRSVGNPLGNPRPENTGRSIAIRELRVAGASLREVATHYGLTISAVSLIARGLR